jgi:hypothetical protein
MQLFRRVVVTCTSHIQVTHTVAEHKTLLFRWRVVRVRSVMSVMRYCSVQCVAPPNQADYFCSLHIQSNFPEII